MLVFAWLTWNLEKKSTLVKIEKLKKKFEDELRRSCITKEEYGKRVRVTLELIGEYNNYKNSVEILEHIFLEDTD